MSGEMNFIFSGDDVHLCKQQLLNQRVYLITAPKKWHIYGLRSKPHGSCITEGDEVTVNAVLGRQTLDLISGQLYQSFVTVSVPTAREHSVTKCPFPCQLPCTIFLQKDWLQIPIISKIPFVSRIDSTNCEAVPSAVGHIHWLLQVQILVVRIWWSIREYVPWIRSFILASENHKISWFYPLILCVLRG